MKPHPPTPRRIVSLVPSITETLCEFGLSKNLAAVTDYCVRPARALSGVPRIGGPLNPSIRKILSLKPDIVFASDEENRKQDATACRCTSPASEESKTRLR
jgi:ABC-type Fe3+-hydroxamate transport system substrate-binding protein